MSAGPTTIPKAGATVVVIGGPADLIEAVRNAAGVAAGASVESAELGSAATLAALHRPFAIVMTEEVYAFDAEEFEALARDVRATLIRLSIEGKDRGRLERQLMPLLGRALRKRG